MGIGGGATRASSINSQVAATYEKVKTTVIFDGGRKPCTAFQDERRAGGGAGALLAQELLAVAVARGAGRGCGGGAWRGGGGDR